MDGRPLVMATPRGLRRPMLTVATSARRTGVPSGPVPSTTCSRSSTSSGASGVRTKKLRLPMLSSPADTLRSSDRTRSARSLMRSPRSANARGSKSMCTSESWPPTWRMPATPGMRSSSGMISSATHVR